jgi:protein-tyrosine sulfotransferase
LSEMKFIFIGGCGRSGTTLVQKLLVLHSKISGGGEFDFMPQLLNLYGEMNQEEQLKRQAFFYGKGQLALYWRKFIEELIAGNIKTDKYEYISEKTPSNIDCAERILDLIPDSKFIYVYRDGRDVVNSYKEVRKRARENGELMKFSIRDWAKKWNDASRRYSELKGNNKYNGRHIAVKYEELISKPEETLKQIMIFLGLKLEEQQLIPEAEGANVLNMKVDGIWYTDKMYEQKINARNSYKWQKELTLLQRIMYQTMMAYRLKEYGYAVSPVYIKLQLMFKKVYLSLSK